MPSATIASGASLSGSIDMGCVGTLNEIIGIVMPSAWTAADLTFQASEDNLTFNNVYNDAGTELAVTAAASRAIGLRQDARAILARWRFVKIRSGTAGTPVNQDAARTIVVATK